MKRRVVSTPLPPGVLELREVVNVLDGGNGWTLLRVEWGGTRGRDSVVFLPAGVTDELMGERGTSATDDLRTPVPRWAKRPLGRFGMIHFWAWQLYLHGINNGAHQWKRQDNEWKTGREAWMRLKARQTAQVVNGQWWGECAGLKMEAHIWRMEAGLMMGWGCVG